MGCTPTAQARIRTQACRLVPSCANQNTTVALTLKSWPLREQASHLLLIVNVKVPYIISDTFIFINTPANTAVSVGHAEVFPFTSCAVVLCTSAAECIMFFIYFLCNMMHIFLLWTIIMLRKLFICTLHLSVQCFKFYCSHK